MSDDVTSEDLDESPTPDAEPAPAGDPGRDEVVYKVMHLEAINYDLTDPSPMAHLLEAESPFRYLVIPMALNDAIGLQHAHSKIEGRRPSTHELMTTILTRLQGEVIAARIVRYDGGVFYAELDLMTPRGREVVDCRTSDALTLAMRQQVEAPILCAERVLDDFYA